VGGGPCLGARERDPSSGPTRTLRSRSSSATGRVGGVAPAAPTSGAGPKLRQTGMRRRGRGCGWCDLDELVGVSGGATSALGISRIQELERGSRGIEGWQCPCFLRPISTQRLLHVLLLPTLEEQHRARGEARARPLAARGAARRGCLPSVGATSQPLMI
jgi:hypothetical protein